MKTFRTLPGLLAASALVCAVQVQAATRTTTLDGANSKMGVAAHGCLQQITTSVSEGENCMYDGGATAFEFPSGTFPANPFGEATGPFSQVQYYDSVATPAAYAASYLPTPGDGKIQQVINGWIKIDDNGDGFGANDLISFNITMTSPGSGDIVRNLGSDLADKYTSMQQELAPTPVSSATANGSGGFDYVIGSEGFPVLLTFTEAPCVGQTFGDMECDSAFDVNGRTDTLKWSPWKPTDQSTFAGQFPVPHVGPPQSAGLGSLEDNLGARTTGKVFLGAAEGMDCIDDGVTAPTGAPLGSTFCTAGKTSFYPIVVGPNEAPASGDGAEDVGWDQLVLKVSTDGSGNVLTAEGFDVQEYMIFGPPGFCGSDPGTALVPPDNTETKRCNTWLAGHFTLTGEPAATAVDDTAQALQDSPVDIDVLANDTGFVDDVTVTLPGSGVSTNGGTVVINGTNPGPQAGIDLTFTPALGFSGSDTFDYTADDGVTTSTATVTVTVLAAGANDDTASTHLNTTIAGIPIGANDSGFTDPVTVVISVAPDMGGTVNAINGSPGPNASVTIDFTPAAALGTATYTETFTYELTDSATVPVTDTAVVTVTVNNQVPNAVAAAATAAEGATAATNVATVAGVILGDPPATIAVTSAPSNGTTSVAGNVITYTPTGFFTGTDSYDYTITDVDGETSAATVSVTIGPKRVPTANGDTASVDQDGSVAISVTGNDQAGSGALSAHTVAVSAGPSNGSATVGAGNVITYTPDVGYSGSDSFQYTLTDLDGDTSTGTVAVTINRTQLLVPLPSNSAMDPWSLLLLLTGGAWLRRLQRQRV